MKKKTQITLLLTAMLMLFVLAVPTSAASTKSKALKAYKKYLKEVGSNYNLRFGLAYLDKDTVPELVLYRMGGKPIVLSYKNGKLINIFSPANTYYSHYYKGKSIFRQKAYFGSDWDYFGYLKVNLTKEKLTNFLGCEDGEYYDKYISYDPIKKHVLTKKKADALLKKYVGTTKATKIKYYKNTAANRSKYLK